MRNVWFKKGLIVGIIVLFIGMSVLPVVSSNAVSIQYETLPDKVTSDTYILEVGVHNIALWPQLPSGIAFAKVTVDVEGEWISRVKWSGLTGYCYFLNMPKGKTVTVKAEHRFYNQGEVKVWREDLIFVFMARKAIHSKTLNNPFFNHFPMLEQLLTYRGDIE